MDVTKLRYRDWDDLIGYCTYSAMPVGRFVLDVHGESPATWPAYDALCAALQIINHLQDCGTTIAISIGSIFRSMHLPRRGARSKRSASRPGLAGSARVAFGRWRYAPAPCCGKRERSPPASTISGLRLEVAVIQTLAPSA